MRFKGVLFERRGHKGTRIERVFDVPWGEPGVLEVFGDAPAEDKHSQQLFSAATYFEGKNRGNAGLNSVHAAVLDCDCADVGALDAVSSSIRASGLALIAYTSWSHGLEEKTHDDTQHKGPFDCFRLVLPYSREVSPAEHAAIVPALFGHEVPADPASYREEVLGKWITTPSGRLRAAKPRGWDVTCSQPARAYFIPSAKSSIDVFEGAPLDVDEILRRPTTARPTQRVLRPFQNPDSDAVGALGVLDRALRNAGIELGPETFSGWRRSVCPCCKDVSPSLTVRANGDGLDIHCHATCRRGEILGAVGLDADGAFAPPSALRMELDEQLSAQAPLGQQVHVNDAVQKLVCDIRDAIAERTPTVIRYPAGTGKSYASAKVLAEYASQGYRLAYSTQEHVVAHETRSLLPPDIRARSVHIHSPLVQVGGGPVCQRAEELKERVFDFGVSLLGSVCPRCPYRNTCEAYAEAKQRAKDLPNASVIFVSHAGIRQLFRDGEGDDLQLIVDEMPGAFECVSVAREELRALASGLPLYSADPSCARLVASIARAWSVGVTPGEVRWGPSQQSLGNAVELATQWGRLLLREGAHPKPEERARLKAADNLIRLCAYRAAGGTVDGIGRWEQGDLEAMLPDAAHEALVKRAGVLLSATPFMAALPGFKVRECEVADGAKVTRKMVVRKDRGSGALTSSFFDDFTGRRTRRAREPHEGPSIPWPVIEEAIARALREAEQYECKRVLFVSFKAVTDAIRERGVDPRVELAHYGALRGKNDWQERAHREVSVAYLLGAPRFAVMPTLRELGLTGEAATQAWVQYAAGELTQAEGRLRLPRRSKPCTIFVEGDVTPVSWHAGNVDLWVEDDPIDTPSSLLEGALLWYRRGELAEILGPRYATSWVPDPKDLPALRRLGFPEPTEGIGMLSELSPGRKKAFEDSFSWAPSLDA